MAACDKPGAPYSPYLEVVADEDVDAGDDEQGDDELEHWREYRVPEQHSDNSEGCMRACKHGIIYQSLSIGVIAPANPPLLQSWDIYEKLRYLATVR